VTRACPSAEQLAAWVDRSPRMADDEREQVTRHLVQCAECREVAITVCAVRDDLARKGGRDA
jgi:Na+-translocating ferredoxin:NAD+ oxidoreductase RnfC subunit